MAEKKTAAKKAVAKKTIAKAPEKTVARKAVATPTKRVVARPVTRAAVRKPAARPAPAKSEPRAKPEPRPLPTAPAGHAPVIGADGQSSGSLALPAILVSAKQRTGVVVQAFLAARANARQANAATKNRARVKGGGAKPWRQKGTGRARAGSTRSPLWRHGGVAFGPNGRKYWQRIPARMRRDAFAQVFAARAAAGRVVVYDALPGNGERLNTRDFMQWLGSLGDTGRAVIVTSEVDERVGRAAANVREVELRTPGSLRLADVLAADTLIVARGALDQLAARAGAEPLGVERAQ